MSTRNAIQWLLENDDSVDEPESEAATGNNQPIEEVKTNDITDTQIEQQPQCQATPDSVRYLHDLFLILTGSLQKQIDISLHLIS